MGRVTVDHHDIRLQGQALQGAEVDGAHLLGFEVGQPFHLLESRPQVLVESHLAKKLAQLQDGVGGRGEAKGQHAGDANQVVFGQAHRPAVNPGHGNALADGDAFAKDLGGPAGLVGQGGGVFQKSGAEGFGLEAQRFFQLGGGSFIIHGCSLVGESVVPEKMSR